MKRVLLTQFSKHKEEWNGEECDPSDDGQNSHGVPSYNLETEWENHDKSCINLI